MVSAEAAPLAKTGGLADVLGSLPRALAEYGDQAAIVLPRYRRIDLEAARPVCEQLTIWLGTRSYETSVWVADLTVPFYLVDCPELYDRDGLYGEAGVDYPDNPVRFAVFAKAALEVARGLFPADILHCHDWQAALVPVYLRNLYSLDPTLITAKTLFTIHNLGYPGLFPADVVPQIGLDGTAFHPEGMEFYGKVSYIKGGIMFSDALNTVSPTYAREIQTPEYGFGLDGALRARADALTGILNGVDDDEWNPATDPHLPARYSAANLRGKSVCKRELLRELGLPEAAMEGPLIGIVSRFTSQKGADLVAEAAPAMVADGMYLAALGTGEPEYEDSFRRLAVEYPGRIAVRIDFDDPLAHRIEAGSDLFLMPSQYEPCGLNQIYSMRYGTVPVVRKTGGLDDTIEEGTGFKFAEYSVNALLEAVRAAAAAFADQDLWRAMMRRGMAKDFSWKAPAGAYSALYRRLLGR